MGFKVIETEEELRSAYSAGLLHWKNGTLVGKFVGRIAHEIVCGWRARGSNCEWEAGILVEDE